MTPVSWVERPGEPIPAARTWAVTDAGRGEGIVHALDDGLDDRGAPSPWPAWVAVRPRIRLSR